MRVCVSNRVLIGLDDHDIPNRASESIRDMISNRVDIIRSLKYNTNFIVKMIFQLRRKPALTLNELLTGVVDALAHPRIRCEPVLLMCGELNNDGESIDLVIPDSFYGFHDSMYRIDQVVPKID